MWPYLIDILGAYSLKLSDPFIINPKIWLNFSYKCGKLINLQVKRTQVYKEKSFMEQVQGRLSSNFLMTLSHCITFRSIQIWTWAFLWYSSEPFLKEQNIWLLVTLNKASPHKATPHKAGPHTPHKASPHKASPR